MNNNRSRTLLILVIFTSILTILPLFNQESNDKFNENNPKTELKAASIDINGNGGFLAYKDSGIGTKGDPYIIEDKVFTGYVFINNTNAYFILINCTISEGANGIQLNNVTNGNITENDSRKHTNAGIYISNSYNITVSDNEFISNDEYGMLLDKSFLINVTGNTMKLNSKGTGIQCRETNSTNIIQNKVNYNTIGIIISGCINVTATYNTIHYNDIGIKVSASTGTIIDPNDIKNNEQDVEGDDEDEENPWFSWTFTVVDIVFIGILAGIFVGAYLVLFGITHVSTKVVDEKILTKERKSKRKKVIFIIIGSLLLSLGIYLALIGGLNFLYALD